MSKREYSGRYTVIGPPGTGKTTWLAKQVDTICDKVGGASASSSPVLVCSLTRTAAAEVVRRGLPIPREAVATIHAHGYRSQGKPALVSDKLLKEFNREHSAFMLSTAGSADVDLGGRATGAAGDQYFEALTLLRHRMVPRENWPQGVTRFADAWFSWKTDNDVIDYTDMIEKADDIPPLKPQVILVDEAQDTSALEYALLERWAEYAGAIIAVGDPWQALFTWRGASPKHLQTVDKAQRKILTQSYRIPRAVHAHATRWITGLSDWEPIEYKPRDADGSVKRCDATLRNPLPAVQMALEHVANGESCLMLATCNRHLDRLVALLKDASIPFSNPWRTHNAAWNPLLRRNTRTPASTIDSLLAPCDGGEMWTYGAAWDWASRLKAKSAFAHGAKTEIKRKASELPNATVEFPELMKWFGDNFDAMYTAWNNGAEALLEWYLKIVTSEDDRKLRYSASIWRRHGLDGLRDDPKLHVGTVHSVKGGEADHVFLFPDLSLPAMRGWMGIGVDGEMRRDDVVRTFYVGMTRARVGLHLCRPATSNYVQLES
jgi:DNA helicase-2/ATP-dependent DNA helicase PcrA